MSVAASTSFVSALHRALSIHLIFDAVLDCLEPADRIRCARTCRGFYEAVKGYDRRTYNVNRWLQRFFHDPLGFRSLQAQLGMLISGSAALQFMDRTHYPGSDLDVYVSGGNDARRVGRWVRDAEQYRFTPNSVQSADFDKLDWARFTPPTFHEWLPGADDVDFESEHYAIKGIYAVLTFKKAIEQRDGGFVERKVQVIAVTRCPLWTILNFHNTCVMNFVAYDGAYSLYPLATFQRRQSLCMSVITPRERPALTKYGERGWQVISNIYPHMTDVAPFYRHRTRWVNDRHSWVVPLDTTGLRRRPRQSPTSDEMEFDPVICSSWRLSTLPAGFAHDPTCRMDSDYIARSPILGYTYLVADRELFDLLDQFLRQQGRLEHMKAGHLPLECRNIAFTWWDATVKAIVDFYRQNVAQQLQVEEGGVMDVD